MPAQKQTPPPIDRPLSKAYLRQFVGWSTAYPPGQSEPNSLRLMENVWVDRNGALNVRPGLRHLSCTIAPGIEVHDPNSVGVGLGLPVIGSPEVFYLNDGSRALLIAVRETTGVVGFRVLVSTDARYTVRRLTDAGIGFYIPQGEAVLNFDPGTTHVEYLQINNRILALSDNGEPARMFFVGGQKLAKKLKAISMPGWLDTHKLTVYHPDAAWINGQASTYRTNTVMNPSFEIGTKFWSKAPYTTWRTVSDPGVQGGSVLEIESAPQRTNMHPSPLHDVSGPTGPLGWFPGEGSPDTLPDNGMLRITSTTSGISLVDGPRIIEGIQGDGEYVVALDAESLQGARAVVRLTSYSANGMPLGAQTVDFLPDGNRWASPVITASTGATSLRLSLGLDAEAEGITVSVNDVVVCAAGESTNMFHGGSGTDYFWSGVPNQSASTYHPPVDIWVRSHTYAIPTGATAMSASASMMRMQSGPSSAHVWLELYSADMVPPPDGGGLAYPPGPAWDRIGHTITPIPAGKVASSVRVKFDGVLRGQKFRIGAALMEAASDWAEDYFDGSSPSTATKIHSWQGVTSSLPHEGPSQERLVAAGALMGPEQPVEKTLVKTGGAAANTYKMAFFYTFENEIGESAASKITEIRMQRGWSQWIWETPNANGEPSGTYTDTAELCADQLVCQLPISVYNQAVSEGALRWNLYAMAWTDQDPVPVEAQLIETQDVYPDQATAGATPLPYEVAGWIQVTPSRKAGLDATVLPTKDNRVNSSIPPSHRNGIVAGDRLVLVGTPDQPATISWSSSSPGRYTMFTPNRGGGAKTLTSGNLNLPYAVALWQNPQSVDTLTILCSDDNGRSTSYYMQPSKIESGNTGMTSIMGFEETTSTPGTIAPFGAEVLNNALYRPLDRHLLKSTASNYNINHKTQTDKIANMWQLLESKRWIMSAQLDNRLYYLVHNPTGELLEPGCKGNEIWVYDISAENGHWSRFLIQGSALKPVTVGSLTYMSISRLDGLYYLDDAYLQDDVLVKPDFEITPGLISWLFETNTQGANRAHDAWAHLQQVGVVLGNFQGSMEYGIRGHTVNGKQVNISKMFSDNGAPPPLGQKWDVEDVLLVRRDLKEWYLFASSVPFQQGTGQIGVVQYRYTPVSVNVGYEFGSVETFEYGSPPSAYARNGTPLPYIDYARP